jgi:hypothetical protein
MEKEFIGYAEALALKELGFDEPCFGYYRNYGTNKFYNGIVHNMPRRFRCTTVPLYQQAFRWFRDKHNLVSIVFNDDGDIEHDNIRYNWEIRVTTYSFKNMKNEKNACLGNYNYRTYEESELECLKKLIEIVKNK